MRPMSEGGPEIRSCAHDFRGGAVTLDSGVEKRLVKADLPAEEHHQTSDLEGILSALGDEGAGEDIPLDVLRKIPAVLGGSDGALTGTPLNGEITYRRADA